MYIYKIMNKEITHNFIMYYNFIKYKLSKYFKF